jgi:hypothetical protein
MTTRPPVGIPSRAAGPAPFADPPPARLGPDSFTVRPGETVTTLARAVAPRYQNVATGDALARALASLLTDRGLAEANGTIRACAGEPLMLPSGPDVAARHAQLLQAAQPRDTVGGTTSKQAADLRRLTRPPPAPTSAAGALAPGVLRPTLRELEELSLAPIPPPNPERIPVPLEPIPPANEPRRVRCTPAAGATPGALTPPASSATPSRPVSGPAPRR